MDSSLHSRADAPHRTRPTVQTPAPSAYASLVRKLALILLLCAAAALVKTVPQALAGRGDFPSFYRAAVMLSHGAGRDLYSTRAQDQFESQILPGKDPRLLPQYFYHPPFEALFLLPLALLPYRAAFFAWTLTGLVAVAVSARVLAGRFPNLERFSMTPLWLIFLGFYPVAVAILQGQDSLFLFAAVVVSFHEFCEKREISSGAALALGLIKFQYVIPAAAIVVLHRRPKFLVGFAAGAAVLSGISWGVVGTSGLAGYWHILWNRLPEFAWAMPNIRGLVESLGGSRAITIALSAFLATWSVLSKPQNEIEEFSLAMLAGALLSYHMFVYDMPILLLAILSAIDKAVETDGLRRAALPLIFFVMPVYTVLLDLKLYYLLALPLAALLVLPGGRFAFARPASVPRRRGALESA
jgi:hypothetical protein